MNILFKKSIPLSVIALSVILSACSGDSKQSSSESSSDLSLAKDTPVVYVERDVETTATENNERFDQARMADSESPLALYSPYMFNPGAKLYERSGIDVDAVNRDILSGYFGSSDYDVKDINISPDGTKMVFAAHGPEDTENTTDYTWNIYEYVFSTKALRRIIKEDERANEGHDTNPTYTLDGKIVFSSNRSAGNGPNSVEVPEGCYRVPLKDHASLLHSMTDQGEEITQLTHGEFHDTHPTTLKDGRIAFIRTSFDYSLVGDVEAPVSRASRDALLTAESPAPWGLDKPQSWNLQKRSEYSESTPIGRAMGSNNYTLLRLEIGDDELKIEQLYETVSIDASDAEFVYIDRIVQAESGRLVAILKHKFNPALGGDMLEFRSPGEANATQIFGNLAPESIVPGDSGLYPGQLPKTGWYSALWPYRDGSGRLLVSWSQCLTNDNGINDFCDNTVGSNGEDSQYGIWVYDVNNKSRLPVIRAKTNKLYEDVGLARPHTGADYPYPPFNANYDGEGEDMSDVICPPVEPPGGDTGGTTGGDTGGTTGGDTGGTTGGDTGGTTGGDTGGTTGGDTGGTTGGDTGGTTGGDTGGTTGGTTGGDTGGDTGGAVNNPPTAVITVGEALVGQTVLLDGSESTSGDEGQAITNFDWQIIPADANNFVSSGSTASFTAEEGVVYQVMLTVTDEGGATDDAQVEITPTMPNRPPEATLTAPASVEVGDLVTLSGAGTDPDGDEVSLEWSVVDNNGASVELNLSAGPGAPSFTATTVESYTVTLTVTEVTESALSDAATATIQVQPANLEPVAVISVVGEPKLDEPVILRGNGPNGDGVGGSYDSDGTVEVYTWTLQSVPQGSDLQVGQIITGANPEFSFTPDTSTSEGNVYEISLVVTDNDGEPSNTVYEYITISTPVSCEADNSNQRNFPVTIRDFEDSHPDFQSYQGSEKGIVEFLLGDDGLPVYAGGEGGTEQTSGLENFNQWYRDVEGINKTIPITLTMTREPDSSIWEYNNDSFFPIDDNLIEAVGLLPGEDTWGNTPMAVERGLIHNYHFTSEVHLEFYYQGGESFTFSGDDDLWVFINGRRAIDLGGVHGVLTATINLDEIAAELGIEPNNTYSFDLFHAERRLTRSNFSFQTSINLNCVDQ